MATYKWRVPIVQAVQFDGKNHDEVKTLIGDTSEGEEFLVGTGVYENPEPAPPTPKGEDEGREGRQGEPPPEAENKDEVPPVPPAGIPYDPKAKPVEGPKEVKEPLGVSEGDWVTKDVANGKVEVNPEGFPEEYEYISG